MYFYKKKSARGKESAYIKNGYINMYIYDIMWTTRPGRMSLNATMH